MGRFYFVLGRLFFPDDSFPGNNTVVHLPVCISMTHKIHVWKHEPSLFKQKPDPHQPHYRVD
jgi:hypothetical protein